MMRLQVNENVIEDTTRCKKQFACLSGGGACLCEVKYCLNRKSCFVNCESKLLCNYKVRYGNSSLCSCPTRKEIYNQYRI